MRSDQLDPSLSADAAALIAEVDRLLKALPRSLQVGKPSAFFEQVIKDIPDHDVQAYVRRGPIAVQRLLDLGEQYTCRINGRGVM